MPIGYNAALDQLIRSDRLPCASAGYLARQSDGSWVECGRDEALRHDYGSPFEGANAIYVGTGLRAMPRA
jgi:hypothetical protein